MSCCGGCDCSKANNNVSYINRKQEKYVCNLDDDDVKITHLGHAGMIFENEDVVIISDPWIYPGAYCNSWYQYPRNDHMGKVVREKIDGPKDVYIFVSHEHVDHYDPRFLNSLPNRDFRIIIADYRRPFMLEWFKKYECKEVICMKDAEEYIIDENVKFVLCVEDCEMNRDCGILVKMNGYVLYNGNDCKYPYYEKLGRYGPLDVFAQQFSGATWHPICYDYDENHMDSITVKKRNAKRQTLIKYIKNLEAKMYIPCAGPPVFLDPELIHYSLAEFSAFPRAHWIKDKFYEEFGDNLEVNIFMPGDVYSMKKKKMVYLDPRRRVDDRNYEEFVKYLMDYQKDYMHIFEKKAINKAKVNKDSVFDRLVIALKERLETIKDCDLSKTKIFETHIELDDYDKKAVINFDNMTISVEKVEKDFIKNQSHKYLFRVQAWLIKKVLDGHMTWEEMMISFRPKLARRPDNFSTLLNNFLFQQTEDVRITFDRILSTVNSNEKIVIETPGGEYYEVLKKCPHQGQDLTISDIEDDRYLICPKHCWKFDLKNGGKSLNTSDTLNAVKIDKPKDDTKIYKMKSNDYDFFTYILDKKELIVKSVVDRPIYKLVLKKKDLEDKLKLNSEDHVVMKIGKVSRPYTFIEEGNNLVIYIKLYNDGKMSNEVRKIKEKSQVMIKRYKTEIDFNKVKQYNDLVFFAGGTGITPFFRLIQDYKDRKNINILYSNTLSSEILLKQELDKLIGDQLKIDYYNGNDHRRHVNIDYVKKFLNLDKNDDINEMLFMICGPEPFTKAIYNICGKLGIQKDNIVLLDDI